jgi:hypothetical protein
MIAGSTAAPSHRPGTRWWCGSRTRTRGWSVARRERGWTVFDPTRPKVPDLMRSTRSGCGGGASPDHLGPLDPHHGRPSRWRSVAPGGSPPRAATGRPERSRSAAAWPCSCPGFVFTRRIPGDSLHPLTGAARRPRPWRAWSVACWLGERPAGRSHAAIGRGPPNAAGRRPQRRQWSWPRRALCAERLLRAILGWCTEGATRKAAAVSGSSRWLLAAGPAKDKKPTSRTNIRQLPCAVIATSLY